MIYVGMLIPMLPQRRFGKSRRVNSPARRGALNMRPILDLCQFASCKLGGAFARSCVRKNLAMDGLCSSVADGVRLNWTDTSRSIKRAAAGEVLHAHTCRTCIDTTDHRFLFRIRLSSAYLTTAA